MSIESATTALIINTEPTMLLSPFLTEVTEPRQGLISPRLLSNTLHMSMSRLSQVLHLHRNTLSRRPESPEVQERLGEIARIITIAGELIGNYQQAIIWFRYQPLSGFDNKTAEDLVSEGQADAVMKHLEMLRDGGYA